MEIVLRDADEAHALVYAPGDLHHDRRVQTDGTYAPLTAAPEALLHEGMPDSFAAV